MKITELEKLDIDVGDRIVITKNPDGANNESDVRVGAIYTVGECWGAVANLPYRDYYLEGGDGGDVQLGDTTEVDLLEN